MQNPKSIKELLQSGGKRLSSLAELSAERGATLEHVCSALPPDLACAVITAGIKDSKLTIGVTSAAWAARLRYAAEGLRAPVGAASGTEILRVQIKVLPTQAI